MRCEQSSCCRVREFGKDGDVRFELTRCGREAVWLGGAMWWCCWRCDVRVWSLPVCVSVCECV